MKRLNAAIFAFVLLLSMPAAARRYILHAPAAVAGDVEARHGLTQIQQVPGQDVFLVEASDALPTDQVVDDVKSDDAVLGFEPDGTVVTPEATVGLRLNQSTAAILETLPGRTVVSYFGASVASNYINQPATSLIRLASVQSTYNAAGAGIVAVIDTGIDPNHVALRGALVPGYDFTRNVAGFPSEFADLPAATASVLLNQSTAAILENNAVAAVNQSTAAILEQSTAAILEGQLPAAFGHGTMVSGIVHLVAPGARIMPLKAFTADGMASTFDIIRAIYFAANNGATVINMSFSLVQMSSEFSRAVNYASANGVICIASVGNDGKEILSFPASLKNVIGVASTTNLDVRSTFSNFGAATADVAAPGEAVITLFPGNNYAAAWGTSFAAPQLSGAAAVLNQVKPGIAYDKAMSSFAKGPKVSGDVGEARLDLYQAVQAALKN